MIRSLARSKVVLISAVFLVLLVLIAAFGPLVYPVDPAAQDVDNLRNYPTLTHLLGTDDRGRDTLARLMIGMRVSLIVAVVVEAFNIIVGAGLGVLAGYFGGLIDILVSRIADMLFAFPGLLLAILISAIFGSAVGEFAGGIGRLLLVSFSLALVGWPLMARYTRGQTLALRERLFIEGTRALGADDRHILLHHIVPNLAGLIIVGATLDVASVIVSEATLGLLGLSAQNPQTSLGKMIVEAFGYITLNWTQVLFPSLVLALFVLALSFVGDGLQEYVEHS
ncbi:MAG TPA: ABC transporter permease [Anaerolineae bacterium]|jgi:peptide/nickel transport system permease protein